MATTICGQCGTPIHEKPGTSLDSRQPCLSCGSKTRLTKVQFEAKAQGRVTLGTKAREPGRKKPFHEAKVGDDFHRKTGKWNSLERTINRRNDRYRERIVDPSTGEVLRDVDEPLSHHVGHGSAKPAKKQFKSKGREATS